MLSGNVKVKHCVSKVPNHTDSFFHCLLLSMHQELRLTPRDQTGWPTDKTRKDEEKTQIISLKARLLQRVKKRLVNAEELASRECLQLQDLERRLQEKDGCIELSDMLLVANLLNIQIRCAMTNKDFVMATARDKDLEGWVFDDAVYGHEATMTLRVFQSRIIGHSGKLHIQYDLLEENKTGQLLLVQENKLYVVKAGTPFKEHDEVEVSTALVPLMDSLPEAPGTPDGSGREHAYRCIFLRRHGYEDTYMHTYIHTYVHAYIHTSIHACIT